MHIYLAGIGGSGIAPLLILAQQAGYHVSGSDIHNSAALDKLRQTAQVHIDIGQTGTEIARTHTKRPIDWYVYSSAVGLKIPTNQELQWVRDAGIKATRRDEFLNHLLQQHQFKLLAVAGTHGKTTTTAMLIWACHALQHSVNYSLGGKLSELPPAQSQADSDWFVYEADEFDRNFLAFQPQLSLITGIDYDHHDIYPSRQNYREAFAQFIQQSEQTIIAPADLEQLSLADQSSITVVEQLPLPQFTLLGRVNRANATLAWHALKVLLPDVADEVLIATLNNFPGSWRRFEKLADNVYTDYAHNPLKIAGCLATASELQRPIVVIYEPLTNRRQHDIRQQYYDLFTSVEQLYWIPTALVREDPNLPVLTPADLIAGLNVATKASPAELNDELKGKLQRHLDAGAVIVGMAGGASQLDLWLRANFGDKATLKF